MVRDVLFGWWELAAVWQSHVGVEVGPSAGVIVLRWPGLCIWR